MLLKLLIFFTFTHHMCLLHAGLTWQSMASNDMIPEIVPS